MKARPLSLAIDAFFMPGGSLARVVDNYEERASQRVFAQRIAQSLADSEGLVAEAGTGTGKTLAYLVPALLSGRKTVVSTGTKNLQEQIIQQELPVIERALGRRFDVQVMKGRANYLCELKYHDATVQSALPHTEQRFVLDMVEAWREKTQTGDRAELSQLADKPMAWRELTATSEQCVGKKCVHYESCWVTQMRRRAQTADLVIVNHHLYFADAALRERVDSKAQGLALIPPHDVVVFDEAHELEEVAAQHFGFQVSDRRFYDLTREIARAGLGTGLFYQQLMPLLEQLKNSVSLLFEPLPFERQRQRFHAEQLSSDTQHERDRIEGMMSQLEAMLSVSELQEGKALARRTSMLRQELAFILSDRETFEGAETSADDVSYVRYSESTTKTRAFLARPLGVAASMQRTLRDRTSIFASATLSLSGSFSHFKRQLGLDCKELLVDSPFDYGACTSLYLPDDLPTPDEPGYDEAAAKRCAELVMASRGGAFVLCTSHRMLPLVRDLLRQNTSELDIYMQGETERTHLIESFRRRRNAVLIATMSFWQGVDVPGQSLRLVIIDRLPFASPSDPITQARLELLQHQGQSPFFHYQLPQAALLLRQGFGRLIRTQTDRGLVAILDKRIQRRSYGKVLLKSLPTCPRIFSLHEALECVSNCASNGN